MSDAPDLSMDELLEKVAEAKGMPAPLAKRSAEARAKKTGESLEDVLLEWAGLREAPVEESEAPGQPAPESGEDADGAEDGGPSELEIWADALSERLGAEGAVVEFDTVRIMVDRGKWVDTIVAARGELPFFSWLSAIDWSKETEVGEGVDDPDALEERFEVLCRLSSIEDDAGAIFVTTLPKDDATIGSISPHIGGASWHEREAHEMFGIEFEGHGNLIPLYLPDDFIGNPLLKSYPLISREVKPWPGDVDVEDMPASEEESVAAEGGAA